MKAQRSLLRAIEQHFTEDEIREALQQGGVGAQQQGRQQQDAEEDEHSRRNAEPRKGICTTREYLGHISYQSTSA